MLFDRLKSRVENVKPENNKYISNFYDLPFWSSIKRLSRLRLFLFDLQVILIETMFIEFVSC